MTIRRACWALIFGLLSIGPWAANAEANRWRTRIMPLRILAPQQHRQEILNRPNRPGHIYGNTVRNMYYRGTPLPGTPLPAPTNQVREFGR